MSKSLLFAQLTLAHRLRRDRYRDKAFSYGVRPMMGYMPPMRFTEQLYHSVQEMAGIEREDTLVMLSAHIAMQAISQHRNRLSEIISTAKKGGLSTSEKRLLLIEAENIRAEIAELSERMEAIDD